MSDYTVSLDANTHDAITPGGAPDGVSEANGLAHVPISRAELNGWDMDQLLWLQEIAERASARLGVDCTP